METTVGKNAPGFFHFRIALFAIRICEHVKEFSNFQHMYDFRNNNLLRMAKINARESRYYVTNVMATYRTIYHKLILDLLFKIESGADLENKCIWIIRGCTFFLRKSKRKNSSCLCIHIEPWHHGFVFYWIDRIDGSIDFPLQLLVFNICTKKRAAVSTSTYSRNFICVWIYC